MKELRLAATLENIDSFTEFTDEILLAEHCPNKERAAIDIALDEILSNIVRYAYPSGNGYITLRVETLKNAVIITFIDSGSPFNPLETAAPDVTLSADERKVGGLGIFLVKKMTDGVEYEYKDGCNVLTVTKLFGDK